MRLLRHNKQTHNEGKMTGVRRGIVHALAAFMFCIILSIGTVCYADEVAATVTVASAKIRAAADPNSQQLGSAKEGGTVSIIGQTTGTDGKTWYQVFVDANTKGFIRADLVKVTGEGTINTISSDTAATTTTTTDTTAAAATDTQVTAVEAKSGTVVTNNVRIRKGASTNADVVATANRGMVVTVTGEAAGNDGKNWFQVSFTYNSKEITGFIRSDLVTFDALPADTAQSTITGTTETEQPETDTTAQEPVEEEPATEEQPQEQTGSSGNDTDNIILLNVEETPYIMPEFTPIILKWEGQDINAFKNGDFYIFYAQKQNGEEGWYVFDSTNGVYERYVYATAGATIPQESTFTGNLLLVIILVVIIVILVVVIGLMFLKLREYTGEYEEYDDDEEDADEEYSEEEESEEAEDEEEAYEEPVKRPVQQPRRQPAQQQQPVRQQQGQARREEQPRPAQQPARRPEGQQPRRPQQQGQQVRHPEGEEPVRRQPGQNQVNRPANRPNQPQGNAGRRPAGQGQQQRPAQQRPQQQGRKAKNFLEAEDDDMEFIDI